jgi:cysteine synthase
MTTPLLALGKNLLVKMEVNNPAGSHKVRAARFIIDSAIKRKEIIIGETTVIEKTGGNFGFGLALVCAEYGIAVELAIGLSFSPLKRKILSELGVGIIGVDMLQSGKIPREVVEWHLSNQEPLGKKYFYTDQFKNPDSLRAHELFTGPEISNQLRNLNINEVTLVKCAGTGASISGVTKSLLKDGFKVKVVLVEPHGCDSRKGIFVDHKMEGMSVGVTPPFIDWNLIDEVQHVRHEEMNFSKIEFFKKYGYFIGNTSAACFHVSKKISIQGTNEKTLMFVYDHGLWY